MTFAPMRRAHQSLPQEQCESILASRTAAVLALCGNDGFPYAVPVSYVTHNGKLYIHGAQTGHKINLIRENPRVSFCVIDADTIVAQELTTEYRSVIGFGQARLLTDENEKITALKALCTKYAPGHDTLVEKEIALFLKAVAIIEISIDHLSGKDGLKLAQQRAQK